MPETAKRQDPLMAFRFVVDFPGMGVAGFSEITGIQAETEVQEYMEGGLNTYVHKFPTRTKHSNLTLKRGVVDRALWDWYLKVVSGKVELKTGTVRVQDTAGNSVVEWSVLDAFPSKWVGPDLNASQSNVAVETVEIVHHGLVREK